MKILIAENIRNMRKQRGMMQEQLAEALGVSVAAVSKWERGAAMPDLSYIAEMADLFGVSLDALVGYRVQNGACGALEERIHTMQKQKRFADGAAEAEKALTRYPNDFRLVYRCGTLYRLKGIEGTDPRDLERAIELLNHAVPLLPQNTDPEISEFSIQSEIAECWIALGKKERGLALLKQYNTGGVHNSLIGLTYATSESCRPEEAVPYLTKAFGDCINALIRTMTGYANYYGRIGDDTSTLDACLWMIRFLESIRLREEDTSFVDKLNAACYAECARLSEVLGRPEDAEAYLRKALTVARRFDAAPKYDLGSIRFCIGKDQSATVYDDIGATAMGAIEDQMRQSNWSDRLRHLWQKLTEEAEMQPPVEAKIQPPVGAVSPDGCLPQPCP